MHIHERVDCMHCVLICDVLVIVVLSVCDTYHARAVCISDGRGQYYPMHCKYHDTGDLYYSKLLRFQRSYAIANACGIVPCGSAFELSATVVQMLCSLPTLLFCTTLHTHSFASRFYI